MPPARCWRSASSRRCTAARREGGSWHVRVSLAGTGRWLRGLGRVADGLAVAAPDLSDCLEASASPIGRVDAVRHAVRMARTPPGWLLPTVPLGTHAAAWDAGPLSPATHTG